MLHDIVAVLFELGQGDLLGLKHEGRDDPVVVVVIIGGPALDSRNVLLFHEHLDHLAVELEIEARSAHVVQELVALALALLPHVLDLLLRLSVEALQLVYQFPVLEHLLLQVLVLPLHAKHLLLLARLVFLHLLLLLPLRLHLLLVLSECLGLLLLLVLEGLAANHQLQLHVSDHLLQRGLLLSLLPKELLFLL